MTFTKVSYLTAALALGIASLFAQPVVAQQLTAEQEQNLANIEKLLRHNPDIIPSVAQSLEQFVEQQSAQRKAFNNYHDWLYKNPSHPTLGAADGLYRLQLSLLQKARAGSRGVSQKASRCTSH